VLGQFPKPSVTPSYADFDEPLGATDDPGFSGAGASVAAYLELALRALR
jgi:hypothetical protein